MGQVTIAAKTTAHTAAATQATAVPSSRIGGSPASAPIRMLAVAYMPAGKTIIHSSRPNPLGAWPRSHRAAPMTGRTGMSPVATAHRASAMPITAGRDAANAANAANARGSARLIAAASISLGDLVSVAGHELIEDVGQLVQALQVSPGEPVQDLVPLGGQADPHHPAIGGVPGPLDQAGELGPVDEFHRAVRPQEQVTGEIANGRRFAPRVPLDRHQ